MRPARRTARRPITSATPSATSDFRRSAVPKAIARGDVHEHPRRERALGDVVAHVRVAGAGGGGGVELADVVADLVRPDLRELGPHAQARRAPLARKGAGRAVGEDEVERLDQRRLHRARALRPGRGGEQAAHAAIRSVAGERGLHAADALEHAVEQVVGLHAVAERVVREHEAVAQDVRGEVGDVLGHDVVAAAQQRERLGGLDGADRAARGGAELDQALQLVQAVLAGVARGVAERDGVADHVAVHVHAAGAAPGSAAGPRC